MELDLPNFFQSSLCAMNWEFSCPVSNPEKLPLND